MTNDVNTARRHHYVPEFYLKAWNDPDQRGLWVYARDKQNRVRPLRRFPKSLGYATDLYSLEPEPPHPVLDCPSDAIEKEFFAPIDDGASRVHRKLLATGVRELTAEDRMLWSLFLNSLLERSPTRIEQIEQSMSPTELGAELAQRLGNREWLSKINLSAMCRNAVRRALVDFIRDPPFVSHLAAMRWATVDILIDQEHLVTGDRPLLVNAGGAQNPVHCLSMALSPRRLLVIHSNAEDFDDHFVRTLTVLHNIAVIRQTEHYVVSSRELNDGPHTKYSRAVRELLKDLRPPYWRAQGTATNRM